MTTGDTRPFGVGGPADQRPVPSLEAPSPRYGEKVIKGVLALCALLSVVTTTAIVVSLLIPTLDFLSEVSYRLAFLMRVLGMLFSLLAFFFLTKMIDPNTKGLQGIPPFDWLLVGLSFQFYFSTALYSFSARIRSEPGSWSSSCCSRKWRRGWPRDAARSFRSAAP